MSDNFTKQQIQALQKEFQKYDDNGDNSMTTKVSLYNNCRNSDKLWNHSAKIPQNIK